MLVAKRVIKSNVHYTRRIAPKRVTSGGTHLRGLASGQHSAEKTSQRWRAVSDTVSDLTGLGIEPQTFRIDSNAFKHYADWLVLSKLCITNLKAGMVLVALTSLLYKRVCYSNSYVCWLFPGYKDTIACFLLRLEIQDQCYLSTLWF